MVQREVAIITNKGRSFGQGSGVQDRTVGGGSLMIVRKDTGQKKTEVTGA